MSDRFPEFFDQIRKRPKFVKAAAADPRAIDQLEDLQRRLENLARSPQHIELVDELIRLVNRKDLSLKKRLLSIGKHLTDYRDRNRLWELN
jgi:hypothetical protein